MWKLGLRGRAIPRKGIHKWDFHCSVLGVRGELFLIFLGGIFYVFFGWDLAQCGWDLAQCKWDLAQLRMRSSPASDGQCTSCNGPGFDPSIRRHSGIWGAADEAVFNIVRKKVRGGTLPCRVTCSCDGSGGVSSWRSCPCSAPPPSALSLQRWTAGSRSPQPYYTNINIKYALIKTKTKFFSYIRKFRWDRLKGFLIYEEMRNNFIIYELTIRRP